MTMNVSNIYVVEKKKGTKLCGIVLFDYNKLVTMATTIYCVTTVINVLYSYIYT